jgi:hypothetical protein
MKYQELVNHLAELRLFLGTKFGEVAFSERFDPAQKPVIGDWADQRNLPIPVRGDGIGDKSGVYFITSEDYEVLYIGKATMNNLHERIWAHLQTPKVLDNEWRIFPNNNFQAGMANNYRQLINDGRVKIGIIAIHPTNTTSLVEVYLQTIHLPPLCKQIG